MKIPMIAAALAIPTPASWPPEGVEPVDVTPESEAGLETKHPSQMIMWAAKLFQTPSRKNDALFWFYAGQLRWRMRLECNPPEPGGEGALFGAMHETVGSQINLYAGDNVDNWVSTIDRVLAWDAATPARFAEDKGKRCDTALANQRVGLGKLRASILAQRAEIENAPVRKR